MPMPRYAKQRDKSESAIFKALRHCGVSVVPADTPVDAWLGIHGRTYPCEIKTPDTQYGKKLNANQQAFSDTWQGSPILVFRTPGEAVDWANAQRKNNGI